MFSHVDIGFNEMKIYDVNTYPKWMLYIIALLAIGSGVILGFFIPGLLGQLGLLLYRLIIGV